jgi:hypothetical protein
MASVVVQQATLSAIIAVTEGYAACFCTAVLMGGDKYLKTSKYFMP